MSGMLPLVRVLLMVVPRVMAPLPWKFLLVATISPVLVLPR